MTGAMLVSALPRKLSMNLMSLDIGELLKHLGADKQDAKEQEDLLQAVANLRLSKEFDLQDKFEMAIFHVRRASRFASKYYKKCSDQEKMQIVLAPFYYRLGCALGTYVECNVNEMNHLKPLVVPEDDLEEFEEVEEKPQQ